MGFFSKVWKGVKKHVKRIARSVKKVSKKIVTALPGGKALWKAGTKIGQGVMKGIGKITNALGPVGMFALNFVLPGIGTAISGFASALFSAIPGSGMITQFASEMAKKVGLDSLSTFGSDAFNGVNGKLDSLITKGVKMFKNVVPKGAKDLAGNMVKGFKQNFPDAAEKLGKLSDKVFDTTSFTEDRVAKLTSGVDTTLTGAEATRQGLAAASKVNTAVANPSLLDKAKLFGEQTGISKAVKVGKNIKGLAEQAGIGGAAASAPAPQVAGAAQISPAATTRQPGAGTPSASLRAAGGQGQDFFAQLVSQAQQSRGGFA